MSTYISKNGIKIQTPKPNLRPNPKKKIPQPPTISLRRRIFLRDNYACVYCGSTNKSTFTLDHIIPKSKGGTNDPINLVTCCFTCNQMKADSLWCPGNGVPPWLEK